MNVPSLLATLRIPPLGDNPRVLFEVRRLGVVPGWFQVVLVVGLFLATVFLTNHEYKTKGTTFGVAGPGFNVLVNPIYEELIFRGWILGRLTRWRSPTAGVVVSSVLFGLLHLRNIFWLEPAPLIRLVGFTGIVLGPLFGYVTLRCLSVWPAVILHYMNNLSYFLRH
jgi:membrane protease YdiL (CAAX protease family)